MSKKTLITVLAILLFLSLALNCLLLGTKTEKIINRIKIYGEQRHQQGTRAGQAMVQNLIMTELSRTGQLRINTANGNIVLIPKQKQNEDSVSE